MGTRLMSATDRVKTAMRTGTGQRQLFTMMITKPQKRSC